MIKILLLLRNLIALRTVNYKLINLLWNECDIPVVRYRGSIDSGIFRYDEFELVPLDISLSPHSSKKALMTTLLHEMGHLMDYKRNMEGFYGNSENSRKITEKKAWMYAIRLSDKYGILIDYIEAIRCLGSYNTNYRVLENRARITFDEILNMEYNSGVAKYSKREMLILENCRNEDKYRGLI